MKRLYDALADAFARYRADERTFS